MICINCKCPDYWHIAKDDPNPRTISLPGEAQEGWVCTASVDNDHFCPCKGYVGSHERPPHYSCPHNDDRPCWDCYFIRIARTVSERSTCNRAHVGIVITEPYTHRILATGYNGAPSGVEHCPEDESLLVSDHCHNALHAEPNIVFFAKRTGINIERGEWHIWPFGPCINCQEMYIVKSKASRVVYPNHPRYPYTTNYKIETMTSKGIIVDILDWKPTE